MGRACSQGPVLSRRRILLHVGRPVLNDVHAGGMGSLAVFDHKEPHAVERKIVVLMTARCETDKAEFGEYNMVAHPGKPGKDAQQPSRVS